MEKLDIGSGSLPHHVARGDVNIDIEKPQRLPPNFIRCDAHHLPFKDKTFLEILAVDVIEHLEAPIRMLREAYRVLKDDGLLIVGTPNALFLPRVIRQSVKDIWHPPGRSPHLMTWTFAELKQLFYSAGFEANIKHSTYASRPKKLKYSILTKLCPVQALKHNKLVAFARKR